jgi:exopolyphosphatase/guanosine-5'-triphosphate,3'-diphosphate pyrophosphatase
MNSWLPKALRRWVCIGVLAFGAVSSENRCTPTLLAPWDRVALPVAKKTREKKTSGLRYWMLQVLEGCKNVEADFGSDPVHDLRVALRRCRSLADGLMALDPDPEWKAMKKSGKRLFQRLGDLRDIHVMEEWVEKLAEAERGGEKAEAAEVRNDAAGQQTGSQDSADPPATRLMKILRVREQEHKREAQAALEEFDRKQWRRWSQSLPARAAHIRPGNALFKHLALERWTQARELHKRALRNRSQTAFHSLRIGIKRFRYIVENFLLEEHKAWSDDLKEMQDVLGEVHDLDVLWSTSVSCQIFPDTASRNNWHQQILAERGKRIERYRERMLGEQSLWKVWRSGLPQGKQVQELATRRMKLWAKSLDPDFMHSERVAGLALQLFDGLLSTGWEPAVDGASSRSSLMAAALLHDVGKFKGEKNHQKTSRDLIREHGNPLGWKEVETQRAAIVARFHRGALPTRRHKLLRDLLPDEQKATIQLSAILRLANALDAGHDGRIRRIRVENNPFRAKGNEALVIAAEGYSPTGDGARTIAAERHLLETILHRPVMMRAMKSATRVG